MTRDEAQDNAVLRLERDKQVIYQWATGTGKSNIVLKFLRRHPDFKCLILVPESNNIDNWFVEFKKFDVPYDKVSVVCYASFHKYAGTKWDLLVFDEMPHVDTEKRLMICRSVAGDYIAALGAVITEDERESLETVYGEFTKTVISIERAIKWKMLPTPEIRVIHLKINDVDRVYWHNGRAYTAKERYDFLTSKVEKAKTTYFLSPTTYNKNQMMKWGSERKRFLGKMKEDAIRRICDQLCLKKKRFICFCSSIEQANKLGKDHSFTSETPASMKLIDKFNNHEIDSIYVVGKLIENQNLNDIDVGVIGQIGGTERITVQSIGRVMRSENPIIYVPVFNDSKDDDFLKTLTDNIPAEYIKSF